MKIKVSHNSVKLILTLEEVKDMEAIAASVPSSIHATEYTQDKGKILAKKLRDAREAANKLNWMDGV